MTESLDNSTGPGGAPPATSIGAEAEQILPLVYEELRRLARARLAREPAGQTLQPTGLVHEAYLRLANEKNVRWQNKAHFFAAAALAMRRILIERARRKQTKKRATAEQAPPNELDNTQNPEAVDLLALDGALTKLGALDHRLAEVVQLRFFAGLTVEQTAEVMGIAPRTVKRDWNYARAWLREEMQHAAGDEHN